MLRIKIFDTNFVNRSPSICPGIPPANFEWYSGPEQYPVCFFTDTQLAAADRIKCEKKIAWLVEPPAIHPKIYKASFGAFDHVLTYDRTLIARVGKALYYPFGATWILEKNIGIHPKSKLISIVASEKHMTEGHRLRFEIIKEFGDKIDVYGRHIKPMECKSEALGDYMFSIAVQNCQVDDYFTDWIIDCFLQGTIPIYWGTRNISRYFNDKAIISFNTVDDLHEIIKTQVTQSYYDEHKKYLKENLEAAQQYRVAEDWMFEHYPHIFRGN